RVDRADAEVRVEEDDEEHREQGEEDLRSDPQAERDDQHWRERDPWQRVERHEHRFDGLRERSQVAEEQPEDHTAADPEQEADRRLLQRDRDVFHEQARRRIASDLLERRGGPRDDDRIEDRWQPEPTGERFPKEQQRSDESQAPRDETERPHAGTARNSSRRSFQIRVSSSANAGDARISNGSRGEGSGMS